MYKTLLSKCKAGIGDEPEGHVDPVGVCIKYAFKITRNYETGSFIRKKENFSKIVFESILAYLLLRYF